MPQDENEEPAEKLLERIRAEGTRRRRRSVGEGGHRDDSIRKHLTEGNFTLQGKRPHIYITSFYRKLPPDLFGGTSVHTPAPRRVRLEFGTLRTDTFVPTDKTGRPRTFFQDRNFVRDFFARTGAMPGDTVLFDEITPYHFRLSLRTAAGRVVTA